MDISLDTEMETLRRYLAECPERGYVLSRGEYLNSRILAEYLGFTFVDPAWCVYFDEEGNLDAKLTRRTMEASLRPLQNAVIAGFYGSDINGRIHTLSRGGSDVTGSLAASAIRADLYENWTDISGLYAADPCIVDSPKPIEYVRERYRIKRCQYPRTLASDAGGNSHKYDQPGSGKTEPVNRCSGRSISGRDPGNLYSYRQTKSMVGIIWLLLVQQLKFEISMKPFVISWKVNRGFYT